MLIGRRIRFLRMHRGMTQKELGKAIGYSDKTADVRVAQYETNTYGPKDKVVTLLSLALNVDESDLKVPDILHYDIFFLLHHLQYNLFFHHHLILFRFLLNI